MGPNVAPSLRPLFFIVKLEFSSCASLSPALIEYGFCFYFYEHFWVH
jgi:hypothetical protein